MASLKDIRRRIKSIQSTQKITRAMKLVAAARLRKAQDAIVAARPYARRLHEVISEIAARADADDHPLLAQREAKHALVLVLTSDRGFCGGFNTNILKSADRFRRELEGTAERVDLSVIGTKGLAYYRHRKVRLKHEYEGVTSEVSLERAQDVARSSIDAFLGNDLDAIFLVYNEFKSAVSQKVTIEQLLPIKPLAVTDASTEFIYEPGKRELLDHLVPVHVETQVFRSVLESVASELGARMTAMENATNNARDLIGSLTLVYNRARQAAITTELMEIIGGAEALKG